MDEYLTIILRTVFLYIIILIVFRIMGKREVGELGILDLIVFIMVAEMAVQAIEQPDEPMVNSLLPIVLLLFIQIGSALLSLKSKKFRDLIDGKPSLLIDEGKINEKEMRRQRYNFDDLLLQLREKDIKNVADVEFAILEPSGNLSVFEKDKYDKETPNYSPFPLILDGKVQDDSLKRVSKTNLWLRQELRKRGYKDIKKISICILNEDESLFVDLKDEE